MWRTQTQECTNFTHTGSFCCSCSRPQCPCLPFVRLYLNCYSTGTVCVKSTPSLSPFSHRPEKLVWHGSSTTGIRLTTNYCEAWRTADMAVTGQVALLQTGRLLGQHVRACSNHYVVLCIENTYVGNMHQRRNWANKYTQINTCRHDLSRRCDTWMGNKCGHIRT